MRWIIILLLALSFGLYAQGFDGIALGMADNYTALSRGVHSISYNPAHVALPRNNNFELNLVGMNLQLFSNSLSYAMYRDYFVTSDAENYWSQSKKDAFLNEIPNDGLKINANIRVNALGFAFNNFALAVQPVVFGRFTAFKDKTLLDIALNGTEITPDYHLKLDNFLEGSGFAAIGVSMAYGYPIKLRKYFPESPFSYLAVGIGINYYIALGVAQTEQLALSVDRTPYDDYELVETTTNIQVRQASSDGGGPVGKGKSYSFGLSTKYQDNWYLSLSFLNFGGSVTFSTNAERIKFNSVQTTKIYYSTDSSTVTNESTVDTTETIDQFDTSVPSYMRLAVAYRFNEKLILTSEIRKGLNKAFGNSTKFQWGVGAEYRPLWWLPLRSGISFGGDKGFLFGTGFGIDLKYIAFDMSFAMKNALWPTHSEGIFMGMNLMFRL